MTKKIIVGIICSSAFVFCYYLTNSLKFAFIGTALLLAYGFWVIRVELNLPFNNEKRAEKSKKRYQEFKKEHDRNSRDNPTI